MLIAANQDSVFARLAQAMEAPELTSDPRFVDHRSRGAYLAELDALIAAWTAQRSSSELLAALHEAGVPCGRVYAPADMVDDPHFRARGSLVDIDYPDYGPVLMPNVVPRLSRTPGTVRWAGPRGRRADRRGPGRGRPDVRRDRRPTPLWRGLTREGVHR